MDTTRHFICQLEKIYKEEHKLKTIWQKTTQNSITHGCIALLDIVFAAYCCEILVTTSLCFI